MIPRPLYFLAFAVLMTAITAVAAVGVVVLYLPFFLVQTGVHLATGKVGPGRTARCEVTGSDIAPSGQLRAAHDAPSEQSAERPRAHARQG